MLTFSNFFFTADSFIHPETLLVWLKKQIALYDITITDMTNSFQDGLALCAIIHRYRPDLLDFASLDPADVAANNQLAFDILEELGVLPVNPLKLAIFLYRDHHIPTRFFFFR